MILTSSKAADISSANGSQFWMHLKTDGSVVRRGFNFTYTMHSFDCGGVGTPRLLGPVGIIASPGYPGVSQAGLNCQWTVGGNVPMTFDYNIFNLSEWYGHIIKYFMPIMSNSFVPV